MIARVTAALLLAFGLPLAAAETGPVDWNDLIDQAVQNFEDPYRNLTKDQLNALRTLVRMRERLGSDELEEDERSRMEAHLTEAEATLAGDGIDIDWVLSQRWVVAERREMAGKAGNPALDGQSIDIGGFLIPAPPTEDGQPTAYLVPQRGMCSHSPPPPPNQLLQLMLAEPLEVNSLYVPVLAHGTLRMESSRREIMVVDGMVPMSSSWTLETQKLTFATPQGSE